MSDKIDKSVLYTAGAAAVGIGALMLSSSKYGDKKIDPKKNYPDLSKHNNHMANLLTPE